MAWSKGVRKEFARSQPHDVKYINRWQLWIPEWPLHRVQQCCWLAEGALDKSYRLPLIFSRPFLDSNTIPHILNHDRAKATMPQTPHHGTKVAKQQILLLGLVLTFANLAAVIHKSSRVYLFQQSQCLTYYMATDPKAVDAQRNVEEELCKIPAIQSQLSITDGIDSFLSYVPGKSFIVFQPLCPFRKCI